MMRCAIALRTACIAQVFCLCCAVRMHAGDIASLKLIIQHRTFPLKDAAEREVRLTRLDYLLSNVRLQRPDDSWIGQSQWAAYVHFADRSNEAKLTLRGIPAGRYKRIEFLIGVDDVTDKADTTKIAPDHPLHPGVNGLHWGWRGGYVYLALEGRIGDGGFSHHIATSPNRMTVSLPVDLDLFSDHALRVMFDITRAFTGRHFIKLEGADISTHSGEDGGLARRIADNLQNSWSVLGIEPVKLEAKERADRVATSDAARGTPYRFISPAKFPQPNLPQDNPLAVEGVELGRRLFHDAQLSRTNTQSCSSCHERANGFTDHGKRFSTGVDGSEGTRNSMALINLAWKSEFFWDGRARSLREQALMPIQDTHEMSETLDHVCAKLANDAEYPKVFERVFGTREITAVRIGLALEQFMLTLVSHDSKFDRAMRGDGELGDDEKKGFALFFTESDPGRGVRGADCFHCHGGADFTDHQFHNNGLEDGITVKDEGRSRVTKADADRGKFATPTLRNIDVTGPYMHDGRFATLEEVIRHYTTGVKRSPTLDPNLAKHAGGGVPLGEDDRRALIAFLKSLTDERFISR